MNGWAPRSVGALWVGSVVMAVMLAYGQMQRGDQEFILAVFGLVPLVAGTLVARAFPQRFEGPLIALAGFLQIIVTQLPAGEGTPWDGTWMFLYLPLALLLLLVPSGTVGGRRWRAVGWSLVLVVLLFNALVAIGWALPQTVAVLEPVALVPVGLFFVLLVATVLRVVLRCRAAAAADRAASLWVLLGGLCLPLTLLLCWASYLLLGSVDLVAYGLVLMYLLIPVTVAVALIRPRGVDVEWALASVAAFALLACALVALIALARWYAVSAAGQLPQQAAIGIGAVAAGMAALAYPALRHRIDLLLFPLRARALAALHELAVGIDTGTAAPEDLQRVLREALRDPQLLVQVEPLPQDGPKPPVAPTSALVDPGQVSEVRQRGVLLGRVIPSAAARRPIPPAVLERCAPILESIRLRTALREASAALQASREQLLVAAENERRKLERDLHDGVQQRLVALGLQLRLVQRQLPPSAPATGIDALVGEVSLAVKELRQLSHGDWPGHIELTLPESLAALGRFAVPKPEVSVALSADLPPQIARTVYFVASEALTNALRHAAARSIRVVVADEAGRVTVQVCDDGTGLAHVRPGGGLDGLSQRLALVGGTLEVRATANRGTTIRAQMPCA